MVFRVDILVRDPDPVFEWTRSNIHPADLVRQIAKAVNYEAIRAGAWISICPPDDPGCGWLVQVFVKDVLAANAIESTWKRKAGLCRVITIGQ